MFGNIFDGLLQTIADIYRVNRLVWNFLAIAITFVLVERGFDWRYFEATRGAFFQQLGLPAAIIGFFVPIILPVGLYVAGEIRRDDKMMKISVAVAQAIVIALIVSSTYKAFTGRTQPEFFMHTSDIDISRDFQFGFWRHGIFWGWPSSHTAVAFAGTVSLVMLYPRSKILRYVMIFYAIYIGLGVSISIHWFSDMIAGAILGTLIGVVAAKSLVL